MATFQFNALTTTATTADQVINTFTPLITTSWKSTYVAGFLTTYSATEANLGTVKLQTGGTDRAEFRIQNTDNDSLPGIIVIPWGDGLTLDGATVMRWIVTPASATSMRWTAGFFGEG
jgi:hypothetical protein